MRTRALLYILLGYVILAALLVADLVAQPLGRSGAERPAVVDLEEGCGLDWNIVHGIVGYTALDSIITSPIGEAANRSTDVFAADSPGPGK